LLQEVGPRLRAALRASDTVARLGGDEFAIVLTGADAAGALLTARKLRRVLEQPFLVEGHRLAVGGSIGIALYPEHGPDAGTLMRRADVAMYVAKRGGSGQAIYTAEQDEHSPARLTLTAELQQAIEHDQLFLHYQPIVCIETGAARHAEALVRWQHPQHGLLAPNRFIPLAEQTGLIVPLTKRVAALALRQCAAWQALSVPIGVAVNLSVRTLHDPQLPDTIAELLHDCGVPPASLNLEITESAIMSDPQGALRTLTRLHDMGVRLSIDDFGTGYSSLAYLKRLPVDELKIDRSFVQQMVTDNNDAVIVRSTIDLAHNLGLRVVAEGVEDRETCERLAALGCDLVQGYYLGRPMPAGDLGRWLKLPRPALDGPAPIRLVS
jgi:predicted signal transduction protein with EAL and GGDEF domain